MQQKYCHYSLATVSHAQTLAAAMEVVGSDIVFEPYFLIKIELYGVKT
jgi:hypothetical protein